MSTSRFFSITDAEIDGNDYFPIVEPVYCSVSIYDGLEKYESDLRRFSRGQRLILAYHWYLSEVNNGGHEQFYLNSTGIVWKDALEAFKSIGTPEGAANIEASANWNGEAPSFDKDTRWNQLELIHIDFGQYDTRLFQLIETVDLVELALEFIRKNRTQFYFEGTVEC